MNRYLYEARFTPNELGGYDVLFPEWGIATQGDSLGDAAAMAQDLLTTYITGMLDQGKTVAPVGTFTTECPAGTILMGIMALVDPEAPEEDTMTAQEAADLLGVSRSRVYAMVRDGVLRARKVGNLQMIFAADVIERYNNPRPAGRPKRERALG